jgi:soluble lytic murein transglycosylase
MRFSPRGLLFTLFWCFTLAPVMAAGAAHQDDPQLIRQRTLFLAAETALKDDNTTAYHRYRDQLLDYPLLPYLDYQETLSTLEQQSLESISNRLKWLEETPLAKRLRAHWLALLAKEGLWASYLRFSDEGGSIKQQCNRLWAMIETGNKQDALKRVEPIWLSGRSQPNACDRVFKAWIEDGHLTPSLVWQRIQLAMLEGQTSLTRYLKRYLPPSEAGMVDRWLDLYRQPEQVVNLLKNTHPMRDEMVTQAIRRLAWRNLGAAFIAWEKFHDQDTFSDYQQRKIVYSLASRLAREPDKKINQRLLDLLPDHLQPDSKLSEKQLQAALQENDWQWVLQIIGALSAQERQQEQWLYWRSRALIKLGRAEEGKRLLKRIAKERSYYGFLAAQRLGDEPHLAHISLQAEQHRVEALSRHPGLRRAHELIHLNRPLMARQEWNLAFEDADQDNLKAAARLAQLWDWPSQSILTLARLRQWNDLELRFPLNHREAITDQARDHGIDIAWIYAILRQESAFMSDARSSAGARGLMQLMPRTAKQVARDLKQSPVKLDDLYRPEVNIKLGAGYLSMVYRQLQQSPVLATAAYNAGPHRVLSWLPERSQASDIWIETIPFKETREYLKRVFAYTVIYSYRLGDMPKSLPDEWLRPIRAGKSRRKEVAASSDV